MNRDPRVDAYLAKAQPFAQPILAHVRERMHAVLPDGEETTKWGAPAFLASGKIVLIVAAFKQHVALNFWRGQELRGDEANADAMGQFGRITTLADLPPDEKLDRLIREATELARSAPAPRQVKHAHRPAAEMPPELAAALDAAPEAKRHFEAFSSSARRDYVDWIAEAKREDTRAKRIATAIEWIGEGKKRHWKYERC